MKIRVAKYEDALLHRLSSQRKIEYSDFILPKANGIGTPWTFVVLQVWREKAASRCDRYDIYVYALDVIAHEVKKKLLMKKMLLQKPYNMWAGK
ncbi:MAG: hypothetical protein IPN86_24635 [Saprospiraceae bacterium]|nr:hypothetical protein [Saprospiraceae bacterium]